MGMKQWQLLKDVSIFTDCTEKELSQIASYLKEKQVPESGVLFQEGDEGKELFIVKEGTVKSVIRTVDGSEKELASFCRGDYFCLLYTSPSPRDRTRSRMPSSA